ncbi:DUF6585 family protein [Streptomyces sp. YGL11-2]|uniref:DUF6585 family protein n=1 Tax=Streptomyces sp. YGL11-2 TaxID=3414028 RepID=UPI003CEBF779
MTRRKPGTRGDELLLARISAAAGREHIGKRHATYAVIAHTHRTAAVPVRLVRRLRAFVRYGRPSVPKGSADARLDLYERGLTIAVKGRIHVVRYDTTSVFQLSTRHPPDASHGAAARSYLLVDAKGERVVLRGRPEVGDAEEWGPEIRRAVIHAQLPWSWAALGKGGRLTFGDVWLTEEEVGSGGMSARWPQVRRIELENDAIRLHINGNWHTLGPTVSHIPNVFVFFLLAERLRAGGRRS